MNCERCNRKFRAESYARIAERSEVGLEIHTACPYCGEVFYAVIGPMRWASERKAQAFIRTLKKKGQM